MSGLKSFGQVTLCLLLVACASNKSKEQYLVPIDAPISKREHLSSTNNEFKNNFHFIILGDRTGGRRPGVFSKAIEIADEMKPDFIISVGDFIEGYTTDLATLNGEWAAFEEIIDRLSVPFFYTVGNHDFSNDTMADVWRERRGRDYYAFTYKDVLFISLNTEDPPVPLSADILERAKRFKEAMRADPEATQARVLDAVRNRPETPKLPGSVAISKAQIAWAKRTLRNHADVRWTIVLMHKPAWLYDSASFEEIETALADRPFTVIAGHEHYFTSEQRNGRQYIDMGTTGGVWLKDGPGRFDHFLWATMSDEGPQFVSIPVKGTSVIE